MGLNRTLLYNSSLYVFFPSASNFRQKENTNINGKRFKNDLFAFSQRVRLLILSVRFYDNLLDIPICLLL